MPIKELLTWRRLWSSLLLVMFSTGAAQAAVVATVGGEDKNGNHYTMKIEAQSEDVARVGFPDQDTQGYMLLRDGKAYMVSSANGQPIVIDMAALAGMAGENSAPGGGVDAMEDIVEVQATGRTEILAGIEGDVYDVVWRDSEGKTHSDEMVLSSDPRVRLFTRAWIVGMANAMAASEQGARPMVDLLDEKNAGVLRFGNQFRLQSLEQAELADAHFTLPAGAQAGVGAALANALAGQQAAAQGEAAAEPEPESTGGWLGGFFGEKADRAGDKTAGRVDKEIDEQTDNAIDKALDKVFDW